MQEAFDPGRFVDVALASYEFRSVVATLVLAAFGFVIARVVWPAEGHSGHGKLIWAVPGLLLCALSLWCLSRGYKDLGHSISRQSVLAFAAEWPGTLFRVDVLLILSAVWLFCYIGSRP